MKDFGARSFFPMTAQALAKPSLEPPKNGDKQTGDAAAAAREIRISGL